MKNPLLDLDEKAFALSSSGRYHEAAQCLVQILQEQPRWEHGYGWHRLADCYENLGMVAAARSAYESAVSIAPNDVLILGGYASFLYLHSDAETALDVHLKLLKLERSAGNISSVSATATAVHELANKLGLSREEELKLLQSPE